MSKSSKSKQLSVNLSRLKSSSVYQPARVKLLFLKILHIKSDFRSIMRIAIEGCAHGELEKIYNTIESIEKQENYKIDLLICCGDFQSTRNMEDLQTMAVPKKYLDICTFYKYYSGEKVAPILTIFIGGNHEASNYLQELPYGGWVAPKIYYLGYAGVVRVNGIRIAGASGIYKAYDFHRGHFEFSPYSDSSRKSVYHIRQLEVFRLKQLSGEVDIFLSHDWPRGIYNYGNFDQLVRFKPHFREDIEQDKLGSPPCEDLLNSLQPTYWFAAHLHCKFAALVPHEDTGKITKFLALDKCLPKRRFLQVLEIDSECPDDGELRFEYDLEWLTILHNTNHLIHVKSSTNYMPGPNGTGRYNFTPTEEEKEQIRKKFDCDLRIPENFCRTVEPYSVQESFDSSLDYQQPKSQINPQTSSFCDLLCIDDPLSLAMVMNGHELSHSSILDESITDSSLLTDSTDLLSCSTSSTQNSPLKKLSLGSLLPKPKADDSNPDEVDVDSEEQKCLEKDVDMKCEDASREVEADFTSERKVEKIVDEITPPMKKFKRRNQCIYNAVEDDD